VAKREVVKIEKAHSSLVSIGKAGIGLVLLGVLFTVYGLLPYLIVFTVGFLIGAIGMLVIRRRHEGPRVEYRQLDD